MTETSLRDEQRWLALGSLMILAAVAVAFALVYTRAVMVPFVLAIFIATTISPLVDFLVLRLKVPGWLAVLIALLCVLTAVALISLAMIVAVQTIVHVADEYSEKVAFLSQQFFARLKAKHFDVDEARIATELQNHLPGMITHAAGTVTSLVSTGFLITIFVVFLLAGRNPRQRRTGIYAEIEATIRRYITTKTMISAISGLLVGLILWALGLEMAALFGLLAFLLNFIPNIGSIVAMLLPVPIAVTQYENPWMILAVVALPGVVHLTVGNVVEPRLMGRGLELHPVTVLFALAFWGLLWGVVGMVLSVPIAAAVRIVLGRFETTRSLGDLMAGHLPGTKPLVSVR